MAKKGRKLVNKGCPRCFRIYGKTVKKCPSCKVKTESIWQVSDSVWRKEHKR